MKHWPAFPFTTVLTILFCTHVESAEHEPHWHLHIKLGASSGVAFPGEKAEYVLKLENWTKEDCQVVIRLRSTSDIEQKWDRNRKLEIAAGKEHIEKAVLPTKKLVTGRFSFTSSKRVKRFSSSRRSHPEIAPFETSSRAASWWSHGRLATARATRRTISVSSSWRTSRRPNASASKIRYPFRLGNFRTLALWSPHENLRLVSAVP